MIFSPRYKGNYLQIHSINHTGTTQLMNSFGCFPWSFGWISLVSAGPWSEQPEYRLGE